MATLYKFGSAECVDHFLVGRTLKFSAPSSQNDINEMITNSGDPLTPAMRGELIRLHYEFMQLNDCYSKLSGEGIDEEKAFAPYRAAFEIGAVLSALDTCRFRYSHIGIMSMTRKRDEWLMWAHYADQGGGICIGLDDTASVLSESQFPDLDLAGIQNVRYADSRPRLFGRPEAVTVADAILTKSIHWRYEDEVRCVRKLDSADESYFAKFSASDVKEIIMGPRMTKESVLKCIELHDTQYPDSRLLWAQPDLSQYSMRFYECPKPELLDICVFRDAKVDFQGRVPFGVE